MHGGSPGRVRVETPSRLAFADPRRGELVWLGFVPASKRRSPIRTYPKVLLDRAISESLGDSWSNDGFSIGDAGQVGYSPVGEFQAVGGSSGPASVGSGGSH